jgi:myo-inositol-1(or 4)-monophosphatase
MASKELASARRMVQRLRSATGATVIEAATRVARAQHQLRPSDLQRKGTGDFVTRIDLRTEAELRRALRRVFSEAGFFGEESEPSSLGRDWIWVVDPIDGTSNFSRGLPHFAVSVALLWQGQPMLGCLHCAPENALYVAVHGAGAVRNGRRLLMPAGRLDDGAIIGCQWHRGQQDLEFLARLQSGGGRIRTLGSSVTQLADVAVGRLDGNVQEQGRIWDIAAAGLVVEEAGGLFTDWAGKAVFPVTSINSGHTPTVAAAPRVHRGLLRLLASRP